MKFDINKYPGHFAMHCKTKEEASDFCNYLNAIGKRWWNTTSYERYRRWNEFREDTVYFFNEGAYGCILECYPHSYCILEWSDFMDRESDSNKDSRLVSGKVYRIGSRDMILLKVDGDECHMLAKDIYSRGVSFGRTNKYKNSEVDMACRRFAEEIEDVVGSDNLITHFVDYTKSNASKKHKSFKRKASLLSLDMFKECEHILRHYNCTEWWWLGTPWPETNHRFYSVAPSGKLGWDDSHNYRGVRPYCIVKSSVLKQIDNTNCAKIQHTLNKSHVFTKANLMNGDVIKFANDVIGIYNADLEICITKTGCMDINLVSDDLIGKSAPGWTVEAVRRPKTKFECVFSAFDNGFGKLVYEREIVEEMTLDDVCKALGKKIKVIE